MSASVLDVAKIREDFPILARRMAGDLPLVYLDSANTSQKPRQVVDAITDHYLMHNANVARAMHQLGAEASAAFESARATVARFIGAVSEHEVVFTKNASEALNLVARVLGDAKIVGPGDEIVISRMEHHSNIVPWQLLAERVGATLRWFEVTDDGRLDLDDLDALINEKTKVVSLTWVSNMLGTINPLHAVFERASSVGALSVVDASQAAPHLRMNVASLGADFVAFTGHKMLGPTGIGVLWGHHKLLASLPPFLGGGEMIETVTMEKTTFAAPPARFEAGTPPIAQAVGLAAAIEYLEGVGMEAIEAHEHALTKYALERLDEIDGLTILGPDTAHERAAVLSFALEGIHPHDISQLLDSRGIGVRAGHHCAKPLHAAYGVQSSTRASFYLYTTHDDVDALAEGIVYTQKYFGAR